MKPMTTEFPRLLVATEFPPNVPGGGGAILRQMLKEWPMEKLFWWSCQPDANQHFSQRVASHRVATIPRKLYPNKRGRRLKCWMLENFWVPWAARYFCKTVAEIRPDVIWMIPHGWSIPPLARVLLSTDMAYHVSVYDYADCASMVERFGAETCRQMVKSVDRLYARATTRDTISDEMTRDLQSRTGATGGINRMGLEEADFAALQIQSPPSGNIIRIAYAGTVIVEQEFALFASTLGKIRRQLSQPVTLELFGDHSYRSRNWFEPDFMKERGNLNAVELAKALKEFDWGFSPMALGDTDPRYNRFSLPTKFGSYLSAGLPVIALGHPECTVVKMASKYAVGLCLTSRDAENLGRQLLAGLAEPNPKTKYRGEILRCATAEFDARKIRAALYENFRKGASGQVKGASND